MVYKAYAVYHSECMMYAIYIMVIKWLISCGVLVWSLAWVLIALCVLHLFYQHLITMCNLIFIYYFIYPFCYLPLWVWGSMEEAFANIGLALYSEVWNHECICALSSTVQPSTQGLHFMIISQLDNQIQLIWPWGEPTAHTRLNWHYWVLSTAPSGFFLYISWCVKNSGMFKIWKFSFEFTV